MFLTGNSIQQIRDIIQGQLQNLPILLIHMKNRFIPHNHSIY